MNTTQLEYFLATAKYGSFSHTASSFYTTQPTVSRQIQLLEDELGYALFDRNVKPLQLTVAGRIFNENLEPVLRALNNVRRKGALAAQGTYGTIQVTFPTGLQIEEAYAELLQDIHQAIPDLHVNYHKMDTRLIKDSLLSQQTDLAVVLHTPAMEDEELEFIDLDQLHSFIVMNPEHPLASRSFLEEEDLIDETMYMIAPMEGYSYRNERIAGFHMKRNHLIEVENVGTALMNIRFSKGVTIVNNYMDVLSKTEKYHCIPVRDNSHNPFVSIVSCRHNKNPAVEIFRKLLKHTTPNTGA